MKTLLRISIIFSLVLNSCSSSDSVAETTGSTNAELKILSLGDSYTIGESVCASCRFPEQLKDSLAKITEKEIFLKVIARTGWTTSNLISAIEDENIDKNYDLVTLLIGVNNQFQNKPFSLYENEFPNLLDKAISFVGGDEKKVIVVSIPDYAFTPFGQSYSNSEQISQEIDNYNAFALSIANQRDVAFINITEIIRQGLENPNLVASDGLHPSALAYQEFVDLIFPIALDIIQQ